MSAHPMHDPNAVQQEIIDSFQLFPEWLDRYQYLIDLGRRLPPLAEEEKTDDKLLTGCQSRVWLYLEGSSISVGSVDILDQQFLDLIASVQ